MHFTVSHGQSVNRYTENVFKQRRLLVGSHAAIAKRPFWLIYKRSIRFQAMQNFSRLTAIAKRPFSLTYKRSIRFQATKNFSRLTAIAKRPFSLTYKRSILISLTYKKSILCWVVCHSTYNYYSHLKQPIILNSLDE